MDWDNAVEIVSVSRAMKAKVFIGDYCSIQIYKIAAPSLEWPARAGAVGLLTLISLLYSTTHPIPFYQDAQQNLLVFAHPLIVFFKAHGAVNFTITRILLVPFQVRVNL